MDACTGCSTALESMGCTIRNLREGYNAKVWGNNKPSMSNGFRLARYLSPGVTTHPGAGELPPGDELAGLRSNGR